MNKKIIIMLLILLINIFAVFAIEKPAKVSPDELLFVNTLPMYSVAASEDPIAPVSPGTGYSDQCIAWDIKNEYCIGDVRHYEQCQKRISGNQWVEHSEICNADYPENKCVGGKCVKQSDIFKSILFVVLSIGVVIIIYNNVINKGGRRR